MERQMRTEMKRLGLLGALSVALTWIGLAAAADPAAAAAEAALLLAL